MTLGPNLGLYVSPTTSFSGFARSFDESRYVVIGIPYDMTSSYRSGSRFGPAALREASLNIETYSLRSHIDLEDIAIADLGDLHLVSNPADLVERTRLVVKDLVDANKVPILLGGEHLVTLGAIKALSKDVAVIDFDAHLDLRDQYMDEEYSHATFMKRATDIMPPKNIFYVGTRAVSKDELNTAKKQGVTMFNVNDIRRMGINQAVERLKSGIVGFKKTYLTVDIDVFDPAYAPAVGNPEADGLAPDTVLTMVSEICDDRIAGLDLVEITPHYDTGITAALGARVIFEALCAIEKSRGATGVQA